MVASHRGDLEAARALHEESLTILRALGNKASVAESLYLLGDLARSRGDLHEARALWEECRAMDQAAGNRAGYVLMALAEMAREQGDYGEAARLLGIRLRECYEIGQVQAVSGICCSGWPRLPWRWGSRCGPRGCAGRV
jgi:tetratricopeptide (TPR) repeat protein